MIATPECETILNIAIALLAAGALILAALRLYTAHSGKLDKSSIGKAASKTI